MKRRFTKILAALALLVGLTVPLGMWGQTSTYTFTSAQWAATLNGTSANWTCGKAGAGFANNGIQVTTNATGANGTSPVSFENVISVVCTYNTNKSAGAGSIVAKIGNNTEVTKSVLYPGSGDGRTGNYTTTFTYDTPQNGNVKLTINTTTNSIYLVSVAITTSGGGQQTVTTPTFSPANGTTFEETLQVTLSQADNKDIYYNINSESDPNANSTPYTGPFSISATSTIKAIAIDGENTSSVATATYTKLVYNNIEDIVANQTQYTVKGTVVATNNRGFVIGDGTGYVYTYLNATPTQTVGNKYTVSGMMGDHNHVLQFTNSATIAEATSSNYNNTPAATLITAVPDYTDANYLSTYLEFEGELTQSSNNYFVALGTSQIQISYPTSGQGTDLAALKDKTVHVKGYFAGYNTNNYFTVMLESVEEVEAPSYELVVEANNGTVAVYIGEEQQTATEGSYMIPQGSVVTLTPTPAEGYRFVEWQVEAEEGTVTITNNQFTMPACYVLINAQFEEIPTVLYTYSCNGVEGEIHEGLQGSSITLAIGENINDDYTFAGWTIDPVNISLLNGTYTLTEEVTTFYAVYAHTTGATPGGEASYVKVTSDLGTSWAGDYLIAYNDYIFADGRIGGKDDNGIGAASVSVDLSEYITDNTIPVTNGDTYNVTLEEISEGSNTYVLKTKDGKYNYQTANTNGLAVSENKETAAQYPISVTFNSENNIALALGGNATGAVFHFNPGNTGAPDTFFRYYKNGGQSPVYLYKKQNGSSTGTTTYYTIVKFKEVAAYQGEKDGYVLVASPVSTTPDDAGMITDDLGAQATPETATYDLYSFNQAQELEWINYRQGGFNTIEPGKGYLYANKNNVTLTFAGVPSTTSTATLSLSGNGEFAGWNLIGNPYATAATPNKSFYRMNDDGSGLKSNTETGSVNPMEGIFVVAETDGETVTFTQGAAKSVEQVVVNLTRNRGTVIDNAIVRFDEGNQLPKFQLFENSTKLYIPQGNKDYAIVRSAAEAEMPVSFRASENGTYTLAVEAENVEMNYLHLIDNMTGMDIDLLQTPSYTFEANTNDYANRFKLVFAANGTDEADESSFAFFSNGNLIVNNEGNATLQVIDINGRILSSETISGSCSKAINAAPGVYMLRLINGENVKVQKVVVR